MTIEVNLIKGADVNINNNNEKEIWKDVVEFEKLYQVSNLGNIYDCNKNKYLNKTLTAKGYHTVLLKYNEKNKKHFVHRLVAKAFIPNPNNLPMVNHMDENKINNCVDNLEWCDAKYNNNYRSRKKENRNKFCDIKKYDYINIKKSNIYINKKCIGELQSCGFLVYLILKKLNAEKNDNLIISIELLLYNIYNDINISMQTTKNYKLIQYIKTGVSDLVANNKISILDINKNYYSLDCSNLNDTNYAHSKDNAYCIVDSNEIQTITDYFKTNTINLKIFQFFCYIISTINTNGDKQGISFVTIEEIQEELNMSPNTVIKYFKILEQLDLLYIHRSNSFILDYDTNKLVGVQNTYSRIVDKDKCIKAGIEYENKYAVNKEAKSFKKKKSIDSFRSWSLKYHWLCNGKEYTDVEAEDIYNHIKDHNEKFKNTEYVKDLTVFKRYGFYDDSC